MKVSKCLGLDGKIAEIQTHDSNDNTFAIIDEIYLITLGSTHGFVEVEGSCER